MTKNRLDQHEDQASRFVLSDKFSFIMLENEDIRRLLTLFHPSAALTRRTKGSKTVLNCLYADERSKVAALYTSGCYISLSLDGWRTPSSEKWLCFCLFLRLSRNGDVTLDVSRFEDVTFLAETEEYVSEEILKELHCLSEKIQSSVSTISSVVSDSAPCNVGARGLFSLKFPELCFNTWFSHQLNLMAGKVST